ncbi:MAG: transglycosylase SLT domain-containing protein [Pseudomonadales bacterium]
MQFRSRVACPLLLRSVIALASMTLLTAGIPGAAAEDSLYQQRVLYRQALDHLTAGRTDAFRVASRRLASYPLRPYLDYYDLQSRLSLVSDTEMARFQAAHGDLPVASIMYNRWLKRLGARREWGRLRANYQPGNDVELNCYYLRALHALGDTQAAWQGVGELWTVGRSQPKACDPLFDLWIEAGQLTENRVWSRMQLALDDNETRLARYLLRFFKGPLRRWAQALYDVHADPAQVSQIQLPDGAEAEPARVVVVHGLKRLARRDPDAAWRAWQRFADSDAFPDGQRQDVRERLLVALAREGRFEDGAPNQGSPEFIEDMASAAVAVENWPQARTWIERLPADALNSHRWQYWLARALARTTLNSERARLTYRALAQARDYYGFLAAEQVGAPLRLNGAEQRPSAAELDALRSRPEITRALELYAVGDLINARREWLQLLPTLSDSEQVQAAQLAQQVGWLSESIRLANEADLRDQLDLRFPMPYTDVYQRVSHVTTVPQAFLLAITRQESIFDPRARSSANARGLMQLLPTTATGVARRVGLTPPEITDLYNPATNVELGGHYLAWLLERYGSRRPLAAAAYNAGENRVDGWIAQASGRAMDVWIETIPFRETRNYVKNVLAFAQVYGQLLGDSPPMLQVHEATVP